MMELDFARQSQAFLWSIPLGAALAVVYGVFRFIRFSASAGRLLTFVLDVLFMLIASLAVFLYCVGMIQGYVRLYVILGAAVGFFAYQLTPGRLLVRVYRPVVRRCQRAGSKFFRKTKLFVKKLLKSGYKILYNKRGRK